MSTPPLQTQTDVKVLREALARAERALQESEARYALAAAAMNDGLWDWNLQTGEVFYSPRWQALLGLEEPIVGGTSSDWLERIHPLDRERVGAQLSAHLADDIPIFECEHRVLHQDGRYHWMMSRGLAVRDEAGKAHRIAGSLTSIAQQGVCDALTGLPNRALLLDRLRGAFEKYKRDPTQTFAVLFMDLNRFKVINDSLGHRVGDLLLTELAKRLQLCVRSADTVARLGGDEFVILLENLDGPNSVMQVIDRIGRYTATTFNLDGHQVVSSTSIGVVMDVAHYASTDDILRDADIAMYHAKGRKKPYSLFDKRMFERVAARQQTEMELRSALERGELFLMYQPIVSLEDGEVSGFEALVRWQHPRRGLVSPVEFIALAEETGLIGAIGEWVLSEACAQMSVWQRTRADPPLTISVNLSSKQFMQPDLVKRVAAILRDTGLAPRYLKLEVTESAVMEDPTLAIKVLGELRDLGVRIAMDDFGTGYSSLSYIHSLPLDTIKIDQSFVNRMKHDAKSLEIVRTVVNLAQNLDLDVVSEGVESAEQVSILDTLHCRYAQGYYFSKPLIEREVLELLNAPAGVYEVRHAPKVRDCLPALPSKGNVSGAKLSDARLKRYTEAA